MKVENPLLLIDIFKFDKIHCNIKRIIEKPWEISIRFLLLSRIHNFYRSKLLLNHQDEAKCTIKIVFLKIPKHKAVQWRWGNNEGKSHFREGSIFLKWGYNFQLANCSLIVTVAFPPWEILLILGLDWGSGLSQADGLCWKLWKF